MNLKKKCKKIHFRNSEIVNGQELSYVLTLSTFEDICSAPLDIVRGILHNAFSSYKGQIDQFVLAGGSAQLKQVEEFAKHYARDVNDRFQVAGNVFVASPPKLAHDHRVYPPAARGRRHGANLLQEGDNGVGEGVERQQEARRPVKISCGDTLSDSEGIPILCRRLRSSARLRARHRGRGELPTQFCTGDRWWDAGLDFPRKRWRNVRKQSLDEVKQKRDRFREKWAKFDWTDFVKKSIEERSRAEWKPAESGRRMIIINYYQ